MIPIELEYREGTLPRRLQDEINSLRKQLEKMTNAYRDEVTENISLRKQLEDVTISNNIRCAQVDTLRKQLNIAVDALGYIGRSTSCDMEYAITANNALAKIEGGK
jgi:septal ring factor EnvC (AmiA/AmiB activator)